MVSQDPGESHKSMVALIVILLNGLRQGVSRQRAFDWLCSFILGLMIQFRPLSSVQSVLNALEMNEKYYTCLDDMFRSDAIDLTLITDCWVNTVKENCEFHKVNGRTLIVSDSSKKAKEGRRMPGVKRLHNDSDTQSKPTSFHGIHAGALEVLVNHPEYKRAPVSIPLEIRLMDGLDPISTWEGTPHSDADDPLELQSLHHLEHYLPVLGNVYFIADRASMSQNLFDECDDMSVRSGVKVDLITNAKCNVVAFKEPEYSGVGRPPKRGEKVKLTDLFNSDVQFKRKRVFLYGKRQTIKYYCVDLLWGLKTNRKIRFVLCEMDDGRRIILACSDTKLDPVVIIRLYGYRFGTIEEDFKTFKNDLGGMNYHFWTRAMPHLSHFRAKDAPHILGTVIDADDREWVLRAIKAAEVYLQAAWITLGIIKILAMHQSVGGKVQMYTQKRTYTDRSVSPADVCSFLRGHFTLARLKYAHLPLFQFIRERMTDASFFEDVI